MHEVEKEKRQHQRWEKSKWKIHEKRIILHESTKEPKRKKQAEVQLKIHTKLQDLVFFIFSIVRPIEPQEYIEEQNIPFRP
jgi:hypothetical protein